MDEPPEIVTLTAEVGVAAEDGTVSLLAPAEIDGATVTEVLPSNGEEIDEDDVILVVEAPSGDTSLSSGAQEVGSQLRVSSPSSGTLEVRAEVGDELSTGDIVATTAPVAAAAAPAELAVEGAPGAQGLVDEDEAAQAGSVPESEDQVQPGDDTQSGLGQSGAEQSGAAQSGAEPRVAVSGRSGLAEITPLAAGDSTIVVTKRTVAQPLGVNGSVGSNTTSTVGATFQLHAYTTVAAGPGDPVDESWATCAISADSHGQCVITVPDTQQGGAIHNKQFWVVETNAAAGTYSNPVIKVGSFEGPTTVRQYPGLTPPLAAGAYEMPRDARTTVGNSAGSNASNDQERSFGAVADSLANPVVVPKCEAGIDIALQLDMSPSIDPGELSEYKNALAGTNGLMDSLAGTNSRVSLYNFNATSPGQNSPAGWNFQAALNVDEGTNLDILKSRVNGLSSTGGATNWDRALRVVTSAPVRRDVLIFITDGAPNYITNTGGGNTTAQPDSFNVAVRSVEAAIYSANAVKAMGTRVLAVGVGGGITEAGENLRAVSGPELNTDYFQTEDWGRLGTQLRAIAQSLTCQVPITVTKAVTNESGAKPPAGCRMADHTDTHGHRSWLRLTLPGREHASDRRRHRGEHPRRGLVDGALH